MSSNSDSKPHSSPTSASADSFFQALNSNGSFTLSSQPSSSSSSSNSSLSPSSSNTSPSSTSSPSKSKLLDNIPVKLDMKPSSSFDCNATGQPNFRQNRKRSNSKSRRQISSVPPSFTALSQNSASPNRSKIDRSQVQYNLILVSLNGTFEKKSLIIPYHPDMLKLGRPAGTKIQPTSTNGYFDSRVLSRNHAQLFADINTGKIYLKDLGSSNGTFVNDEKIASDKDSEPTEIKKGDVIDLGFDIESHQNHRKISARVENILIRPLTSNSKSLVTNILENSGEGAALEPLFEIENNVKNSILSNSFDSALFGDILPNFEDNVLNIKNDSMTGLSINSNLTTSSNLELQIKTLINEIYMAKHSILKTKSIETFLKKYIKNLKKIEIEKNEANKNKVKDYEQQLAKKFEKDLYEKKTEMEKKITKVNDNYRQIRTENENLLGSLNKLQESTTQLKDNLEVEKKEKSDLYKENDSLKNELESKKQELNDWKIRFTEIEAKFQDHQTKSRIDKAVQTDVKKYLKAHISLNDNDSDSSTLNDDDINLQRISKSLISRDNDRNGFDSSHLKKIVYTSNEEHNDNDTHRNLPTVNSDEDLNNLADRNNIITDEKAISEDNKTGSESELPSPTIGKNTSDKQASLDGIVASSQILDSPYNHLRYKELLAKVEELQNENTTIKNTLNLKTERLNLLEEQMLHITNNDALPFDDRLKSLSLNSPWLEGSDSGLLRRNSVSQLSRSPSNVSMTSSSSRTVSQSPLVGLFGPTFPSMNKLRSRNLSRQDFEDNLTDIDEDNIDYSRKNSGESNKGLSGTGMFIKPESTRTSLVTAVGIVVISIMVSKFSS